METYNYDDSSSASALPAQETAAAQPAASDATAAPGFGPAGPVTPSVPDSSTPDTAAPGLGPAGPVMPTLPSGQTGNGGSCVSCGSIFPHTHTGILWTWGTLSPFFSTSSEISHLRFYNASSIREPLDIYLNGRIVVSDLDYMNYTRYLHIIPGVYRMTVYRGTNPGTAILDVNIRLLSGNSYTAAVLGTFGDFSVQMIHS